MRILVASSEYEITEAVETAIGDEGRISVAGWAVTAKDAVRMAVRLRPDLVVMELNIRVGGGIAAAREIMIEAPVPIVLVHPSNEVLDPAVVALANKVGVLSVIAWPPAQLPTCDAVAVRNFLSTLVTMSQVKVVRRMRSRNGKPLLPLVTPDMSAMPKIIGIAASTGGQAALRSILESLPDRFPVPILVVQHIAAGYIAGMATYLNSLTKLTVKVAEEGERLQGNTVYLAPDTYHLGVTSKSRIHIDEGPPINGFKPSGNYLFHSIASVYGSSSLGVILSGMGDDGIDGLRILKKGGGKVIAQNEESCTVFGMPRAAVENGITDVLLPPAAIAKKMASLAEFGWKSF